MSDKKPKKQTMRYSIEEMGLAKNTFADNEDLFFAIRKVFLQMPLDEVDKSALRAHVTGKKDVMAFIRKNYLPEVDAEAPLHQVVDLWLALNVTEKTPEDAWPIIVARGTAIKYLEQQLKVLETLEDDGEIRLAEMLNFEGKTKEEVWIQLETRRWLVSHNEQMLNQMNTLAGNKTETPEETEQRLKNNSNK